MDEHLECSGGPQGTKRMALQPESDSKSQGRGGQYGRCDADVTFANSSRYSPYGPVVEEEDEGGVFLDNASVMMYSLLMPTTSSLVELSETEFMPMAMRI